MSEHYDFSKATKNPFASVLNRDRTIILESEKEAKNNLAQLEQEKQKAELKNAEQKKTNATFLWQAP